MLINHFDDESYSNETSDATFDRGRAEDFRSPISWTPTSREPHDSGLSDDELMGQISRREPNALEMLLGRYGSILRQVILGVLHNAEETEEVLMEVLLRTWNCAAHFSSKKGKLLGWLITMAKRQAIDRLRKRLRYSATKERFHLEQTPSSSISSKDSSGNMEQLDNKRFIHEKVQELPPFQRDAIYFCFYEGMSQREFAFHSGIPLGTIKTRVQLGLEKLGNSLQTLS